MSGTYKLLGLWAFAMLAMASCSKDDQNILVRSINTNYAQFGGDTFDVDGDGNADLFFRVYYDANGQYAVQGDAIDMIGLNGALIIGKAKSLSVSMFPIPIPYLIAMPMTKGTTIDGSYSIVSDSVFVAFDGTIQGEQKSEEEWKGSDMYFGFSLQRNGNTHYGWGQMRAIDFRTLRITDLAYDIRPNTAIKAGRE